VRISIAPATVARMTEFDARIAEALAAPTAGWDFSWLAGRTETAELSAS